MASNNTLPDWGALLNDRAKQLVDNKLTQMSSEPVKTDGLTGSSYVEGQPAHKTPAFSGVSPVYLMIGAGLLAVGYFLLRKK
ncbi:MAG: hypothetical protein EPO42_13280 [Gallionellaceae bacterium]|nr:MAG: hypothetical protein EPO42_13280 [Gallionellaceae bacterium]